MKRLKSCSLKINFLLCQAISDELVLDKTVSDDDDNVEGWIEIEYNGLFPCNLGDGPSLWSNSNSDSLRHNSSLSFSFVVVCWILFNYLKKILSSINSFDGLLDDPKVRLKVIKMKWYQNGSELITI